MATKSILAMIEGGSAAYISYGNTEDLVKSKSLLESSSTKRFVLEELTPEDDIIELRSDTNLLTERLKKYIMK